jgi:Staphylococcal AgrD protein.
MIQEDKKMNKNFSETTKNGVLASFSVLLTAIALFFASAACFGHFYEPEVPQQLLDNDR